MSNPKFTPGPWVKDKYGRLIGSNGDQVEVSNFNVNVCYSTEENEANARLLECATQMYDMIKSLSRELQSIHEADQLLAKARGEV